MWNLSNFTNLLIEYVSGIVVLFVMFALMFPEKKEVVKKKAFVPVETAGGRRRRINNLLALKPEPKVKYEEDYIEVTVTKPQPPPKKEPETEQHIIDDAISALRSVGFLMRDAKAAVLKACEGRVFVSCESLITAALEKPKWK